MSPDWRTAYLRQAGSDYDIYLRLRDSSAPRCQQLHYLQMTAEKLSKGFLCPAGGPRPPRSHDTFVRFMRVARDWPEMQRALGFTDRARFKAYMQGLLGTAADVENLSPEGPDHPNPEYPWEAGGIILSPLDYDFFALDPTLPKMRKLLKLIQACLALV